MSALTQRHLSEFHLREQLEHNGLSPTRWSSGPRAVYGVHGHRYGKILVVASGSITFTIDGKRTVTMHPGDRLQLPPHTPHSAVVGREGVVCLEAHIAAAPSGT